MPTLSAITQRRDLFDLLAAVTGIFAAGPRGKVPGVQVGAVAAAGGGGEGGAAGAS